MADLALVENSFFETPLDVADELAELIRPFMEHERNPLIVDACAGRGVLGKAALRAVGDHASVCFIETNPALLHAALSAHNGKPVGPLAPTDVFSAQASELIGKADLVMLNPPFAGSRGERLSNTLATLQDAATYPDIGCHYLLHVARLMRPGAPLGFVFRRNAFLSRSYFKFWADLSRLGAVVELRDIQRRLRPSSGAAESVIGVFVSGTPSRFCRLRQKATQTVTRQQRLLRLGWRRLGDVARVRAGPSITNELKDVSKSRFKCRKVIDIPTGHDGSMLWGPQFSFEMDWNPTLFSVPRNLGCQGEEGFVYKLAASEFRTSILPRGYHFVSATPAVIPKKPYDLPFIIGCSLLPSWRKEVRDTVGSSNFTPGAVEHVFVPFSSLDLYRRISEIGHVARITVRRTISKRTNSPFMLPDDIIHMVGLADQLASNELSN